MDKDDTLTSHEQNQLSSEITPVTIRSFSRSFKNNVVIVSNNRKKWEMDWGNKSLGNFVNKNGSFGVINTYQKKPFNMEQIKSILEEREGR